MIMSGCCAIPGQCETGLWSLSLCYIVRAFVLNQCLMNSSQCWIVARLCYPYPLQPSITLGAELREETGVQRSLTERLVRSRLQWAGHVERMADDRLPKRAAELREQGRRRRGRPRLRWEDCVKRDVKKAGEEVDWKKKTQDRVGWKRLADEAVKKLQASPHP